MAAAIRFTVHGVPTATERLPPKSDSDLRRVLSTLGTPQAFSIPDADAPVVELLDNPNLFATAVYIAFFKHYPLKINPNIVWLTILQGFALYVSGNAELLRDRFVAHEGKQTLEIVRPDFRFGSPSNDWPSVFPQYAEEIQKRTTPGVAGLLQCDFSNTTPTDAACSHITLMAICKEYFSYSLLGGCGIPWIELLGTAADWRLLRQKAEGLAQFASQSSDARVDKRFNHYRRWVASLLPLLSHFVRAAEGNPDIAFWGSVCNTDGGSGSPGDPITGWICAFFPYFDQSSPFGNNRESFYAAGAWYEAYQQAASIGVERALLAAVTKTSLVLGVPLEWLPRGLANASVKVKWFDVDQEQDLEFYAGIFAIHQHADGALEPRTGWAVIEPRK
jgi:hypothetical protein